MENNLPKQYKKGFINTIKEFFFNLFHKKTDIQDNSEIKESEIIKNDNNKSSFINELKVDNNIQNNSLNNNKGIDIIERIENNPDLLNELTIEKLNEIEKIYDDRIDFLDMKINELSKQTV